MPPVPYSYRYDMMIMIQFCVVPLQMETLKRLLPGLEAGQLVSRAPALLGSTQLEDIIPRRMKAMSALLPGVDVLR